MRLLAAIVAAAVLYLGWKALQVQLKSGADLTGISWRMFYAAIVADGVFAKHGAQAVITSGVDSEHSEHSMHYRGLAVDLRTHDLPAEDVQSVADDLQSALGTSYAVLVESDHIHVQYTWDNVRGGNPYA